MKLAAVTPTVWLLPEVDQRIRVWVEMASGEMSALGLVERCTGGFLVTQVFLPKQACGSADTELDPASVASLLAELDSAGQDTSQLRLWQHSHADFQTFWSPTDESTIRALANGDWTLALVVNKAGDRRCRLDVWHPVHVTLDRLPVEVFHADLGLREDSERLFRERVTERSFPLLAMSDGQPMDFQGRDAVRQMLMEGRLERDAEQVRSPDLGWNDIDDLVDGPSAGDGRHDDGP